MNIGGVTIGPGNSTYVIAEIGSNHDGDLDRARELICDAAEAGADCAKFQLYRADKLYPGTVTAGAIPDEWLPELKSACHEAGVEFMCSVFCEETLAAYMRVAPAAIKIASPEATNLRFIRACTRAGLPLLVSTGAMTSWQVDDTVDFLAPSGAVLLHCVSAYPASVAELNLAAIPAMVERYQFRVGFSDHTLDDVTVPSLAVAAGACIIEKHLTWSRDAEGADHPFALEPAEFSSMVSAIRETETIMGDGVKRVQPSEDATDRRAA